MESFRKMQTLRREFVQAKTLMQLMLEREALHEVSKMIFFHRACFLVLAL